METNTAQPTQLLSFSPDGCLFATCSANDRMIKLWYDNTHLVPSCSNASTASHAASTAANGVSGTASTSSHATSKHSVSYSFVYLPHPAAVTGFTWRCTSKYMPKGSVSSMLVSSCRDNICRVWVETVLPDDGVLAMQQLDPIAAQNPRFRTHRHKHRFISRLKHIKACFGSRRPNKFPLDQSSSSVGGVGGAATPLTEPIATMPTSYSMHDFPSYGFHAMGVTPGFHFHLAASINAATDIPLVPSLVPGGSTGSPDETEHNFVLHWLNNKEMHFTREAENMLLEVSKRALEKEVSNHVDADRHSEISEIFPTSSTGASGRGGGSSRPSSHMAMRGKSIDDDESVGRIHGGGVPPPHPPPPHHNPLSAATSSTSIATDVTTATTTGTDVLSLVNTLLIARGLRLD